MTHKKAIIFLILCALIVSAVCMSVCVSSSETAAFVQNNIAQNNNNQAPILLTSYKVGGGFTAEIIVYIDPQTGVNYLILREFERGGICPRYNADGTLYISEVAA